jgi:hypothetical protein
MKLWILAEALKNFVSQAPTNLDVWEIVNVDVDRIEVIENNYSLRVVTREGKTFELKVEKVAARD